MPKYVNHPDFEDLIISCKSVEVQIQERVNVPLSTITNETIAPFMPEAVTFDFI